MLLLLSIGTAIAQTPPSANQSAAWLDELMSRLAAIPERRCTFREEKRFAALQRPLVSEGRLAYVRPSHLAKVTTAPTPEALVVDGDRLQLTLADEQSQDVSLAARPELAALVDAVRGLLAGDVALLRRDYRVEGSGDLAGWRIVLSPANAQVAGLVRAVTIDGAVTHIARFQTEAANGDIAVMTIGDTC